MGQEIIPFDFYTISAAWRGRFLGGTFIHNSCQSMCYDSRNRRYVVGFAEPGNVSALVQMKDMSFKEDKIGVVQRGLPLGHCNDLAYDPEEHKIYAVGGEWWVAVVDPDTLLVEKKINIGTRAWSIARYPDGDWFIHDGDHGERYSHDFSRCVTVSMNDLATLAAAIPNLTGCWQGAICIDGMPYMIFNEFSLKTGKPVSFALFSCETGRERTIWRAETGHEIESADLVGRKMMLAYNEPYRYGGCSWEMSEMMTKTVCAEFTGVDLETGKDKGLYLDVPEWYELVGATAQIRLSSGSVRALPLFGGDGRCRVRIQKAQKNKVTIRADAEYTGVGFLIAGICRKKEGNG